VIRYFDFPCASTDPFSDLMERDRRVAEHRDNQSPDDESAKIAELRRKLEALALKIEALAPKAAKQPAPRPFPRA
jgi:hypothetical protein